MRVSRLNQTERYRIHALREAGRSLRVIAECLDHAPSTISRELPLNAGRGSYRPEATQRLFERRSHLARRRSRVDADRIDRVKAVLAADWRPEQIAGSNGLASHDWIYRYVYADQRHGGTLQTLLRRRLKPRRRLGNRHRPRVTRAVFVRLVARR